MSLQPYHTHHIAGDIIALHRHGCGYVSFILEGAYDEISADGRWRCQAGDLVIHPPFHLHTNRFFTDGAQVLNFRIDTHAPEFSFLLRYGVFRVGPRKWPISPHADIGLLKQMVETAAPVARQGFAGWVDEFAGYLAQNPTARIGVIAKSIGITPEHASRAFTMHYAMTPSSFRNEQRFRSALNQIASTGCPLADIAQNTGFCDQAHMTRTLRARTDLTPTQIRATLS